MENDGRWFLVEHRECGSVFSINSMKFLKAIDADEYGETSIKECPCCRGKMNVNAVQSLCDFFRKYESLTGTLDRSGFEIREIKTNIDFQDSKIGSESKV